MADTILSRLILPLRERAPRAGIYLDDDNKGQAFASYREIYRGVQAAAHGFRAVGVGTGTRVIIPFDTSFDCIVAFLALVGIGAIPLSIKTPASGGNPREYGEYLCLLISRFDVGFVIDVPGLVPGQLSVPQVRVSAEYSGGGFADWADSSGADIAFVQFSSGTTSEPKGIVIRHGQLIRQLDMIVTHDRRTEQDVVSSWLPLFHDMGLVGTLLTPIYAGHDLHLCSPAGFLLDPVEWLHGLSEHGVSVSAIPNFGLAYLLKRLEEPDVDLSALRLDKLRRIYIGSDTIDADVVSLLARKLAQYGLRGNAFSPCYGMAEAVLMVSCKQQEEAVRVSEKMGAAVVSVGAILEGFELRLVRPDGTPVSPGENGEILLRGGSIGDGYFESDRPMLDAEGFYHTGDMGFVEDGQLYISGRIGDRVKINGQNYFLPHLENALHAHPELRPGGAAIIQASGVLAVLAKPSNFRSEARLMSLRSELSGVLLSSTGVKVPAERVYFVRRGQIKRTSSGKLQRNLVTKAFVDQQLKIFEITDEA